MGSLLTDLDDLMDSPTRLAMLAAERTKLAGLQAALDAKARVIDFDVRIYGATGNGTTDDTTAIQAAIAAAQAVGGTVLIPPGTYKLTDELVVSAPVTIAGAGVHCLFGDRSVYGSDVVPTVSPYLSGAVLLQSVAGKHGIRISVVGRTVTLRDFGVRFADAIKFASTGHGIYADPGSYTHAGDSHVPASGTYTNNGMDGGAWRSVYVYGHDGNHYAFYLKNAQLMTLTDVQGYGGGGLCWHVDTGYGWYGNSTLVNPYFLTCCAGSGHGFYLKRSVAYHGVILMTMIRPQSFFLTDTSPTGTTTPNSGQYNFWADDDTQYLSVLGGDFEDAIPSPGWRLPTVLQGLFFQAVDTSHNTQVTLQTGRMSVGGTVAEAQSDVTGTPNIDGAMRAVSIVTDSSNMAAGVGAGILLRGRFNNSGGVGAFGGITAVKANAIDGNYESDLLLVCRANGGPLTPFGRIYGGTGLLDLPNGLTLGGVRVPTPAGGQVEATASDTALGSSPTAVPGLAATLSAGTWIVSATIRIIVSSGESGYASAGLYDDSTLLTPVVLLQAFQATFTQANVALSWRLTLSATTTVALKGYNGAGVTRVFSDAAGKSFMHWTRVA